MSTVEGLVLTDYCPKCNAKTQRDRVTKYFLDNVTGQYFQLAKCHLCDKLFCYIYKEKETKSGTSRFVMSQVTGNLDLELDSVFPKQSEVSTEYITNKIKDPYLEGVKCMDNFCPNASVMMFRRTLSIICVDMGADVSLDFEDQLKELPAELHLTATEIRKWGNLGAHVDKKGKIESVKTQDAREIKEFLERVIMIVYELPKRLKVSAKKRN